MKNNLKFLSTFLIGMTALSTLAFRTLRSGYREGAGDLPLGVGMVSYFHGIAGGVVVCVLLLGVTAVEWKRNSWGINSLKALVSVAVLVLSVTYIAVLPVEPQYIEYTKGFLARVDRECSEAEVRQWAQYFMEANRSQEGEYRVKDEARIPEFIKRIYPYDPGSIAYQFSWAMREDDGVNRLAVYWSGALPGAWGLEIGPEDLRLDSDRRMYRLEWKPGIYVWHSTE